MKIISLTNNVSNFTNAEYGWIVFFKWYMQVCQAVQIMRYGNTKDTELFNRDVGDDF